MELLVSPTFPILQVDSRSRSLLDSPAHHRQGMNRWLQDGWNISPPLPTNPLHRIPSLKPPTLLYSLGNRGTQFTRCSPILPSGRSDRGNLLLWPSRSISAPFAEDSRKLVHRVWGLWQFLLSTSRPRCSRCSGSGPTFVRGVPVSNRINIWMSAALSPQLQISSLKLP